MMLPPNGVGHDRGSKKEMPKALLWGYFLIVALLCVVAWPLLTDHLLTFGESAGRLLEAHDKGVTALFTIVLAIATAFLWHATYRLWIAGERQVKLSRDTAERQLRAYLTFR